MRRVVLYANDFRSTSDGYHADMWEDILESFNLPKDTEEITVTLQCYDTHKEDEL